MPQIGENATASVDGKNDEPIQYFVSSCLTVTCFFADGSRLDGRFSLLEGGELGDSVTAWASFTRGLGAKPVRVLVAGQLDMWNPTYLTKTPFSKQGQDAARGSDVKKTIEEATGCKDIQTMTKNGEITILQDGTVL
jgi:hypothetical protein